MTLPALSSGVRASAAREAVLGLAAERLRVGLGAHVCRARQAGERHDLHDQSVALALV
jgi:hypothetical protein